MLIPLLSAAVVPGVRRTAKCVVFAGAAALTLLCSCSKPPEPPVAPPTRVPTPTQVPKVSPTPSPTPTPIGTPTPTPIVHHFAPAGTFYVTSDVTVRLKAGLMGVSPGTEVKLLKDGSDTVTVSDGTEEFEIQKKLLTNDLEDAAKIQKGTQAAVQASAEYQRQQQAVYEKQQQAQVEFLRSHPLGGAVSGTPTPTPRR